MLLGGKCRCSHVVVKKTMSYRSHEAWLEPQLRSSRSWLTLVKLPKGFLHVEWISHFQQAQCEVVASSARVAWGCDNSGRTYGFSKVCTANTSVCESRQQAQIHVCWSSSQGPWDSLPVHTVQKPQFDAGLEAYRSALLASWEAKAGWLGIQDLAGSRISSRPARTVTECLSQNRFSRGIQANGRALVQQTLSLIPRGRAQPPAAALFLLMV